METYRIGDPIYIRSKDTKVIKRPNVNSERLAMLQPTNKVTWLGPAPEDKNFHKIRSGIIVGYVLMQNLTRSPNLAPMDFQKKCGSCKGLGYLPFPPGLNGFESMALHPVCTACNGRGTLAPMSDQAFASSGGTKG